MLAKIEHVSFYLFTVFMFSIVLFCYGFFPLSFSTSNKSSLLDLPSSLDNVKLNASLYKTRHSRAVLMVIDALRTDFVMQPQNMPFLNELLANGTACQYKVQVHPPTVTMPRIKAMTSGAIPSFLDVILNLGSPECDVDTFLYQLVHQHQRIVFYGDNTWTSMFPALFHRTGENVDSLYVNDFYEGDRNITKHMHSEFNNYDWKLMILHFLGLDHIGHVEGPFSNKVPTKLQEMDNVIRNIFEAMYTQNRKFHTKSLMVITGDHGMRDSGGHGGSTYAETHVPLLIIGNSCSKSDQLYLQIDVAPTIAALMGVAIPYSSIGSLVEPVLNDIPPVERVYVAYYNTKRLIDKIKIFHQNNLKEQDFFLQYKEAKLLHTMFLENQDDLTILEKAMNKYSIVSRSVSKLLIKNYIQYDMLSILTGIVLSSFTTILVVMLIMSPQSTNIRIEVKLINFVIFSVFGVLIKYSIQQCSMLESNIIHNSYVYHLLFMSILLICFAHYNIFVALLQLINKTSLRNLRLSMPISFLLFGSIFHILSFCSSSYIEEEHQTWYYLANTLFLLLTLLELKIANTTINEISHSRTSKLLLSYCRQERVEFCIRAMLFFCGHIALRRWNQTGDKWQHVPDLGDWFVKEENRFWLSIVLFFGLCYTVIAIGQISGFLTTVLSLTACLLVYYYRLMTGFVSLFGIVPSKTDSCLTIFWVNLLEILCIGLLPSLYRIAMGKPAQKSSPVLVSIITIFTLLSTLIHKPHNVILVAALLSSSRYLVARIDHISESKSENLLLKIVAHIWLGKLFYFYQGNSNNLATIDLNAGYVGLSSFNFIWVGLLLTLNTFNTAVNSPLQ
ncbi:GPI ethanolamine phosphate transferase 2 isoform X2 [Topomyia yanbarensis]|uniref:GPI ethanolamine phosphate transferase 2 isoform X2 n=1 Tax=Topomyia yanbarensis TaxID=2498891 RepID=UPI00273B2ECC|nr:GPI ethanolamine phosphate transferase 2 isoform X2 [Topomyia yanbarensis]